MRLKGRHIPVIEPRPPIICFRGPTYKIISKQIHRISIHLLSVKLDRVGQITITRPIVVTDARKCRIDLAWWPRRPFCPNWVSLHFLCVISDKSDLTQRKVQECKRIFVLFKMIKIMKDTKNVYWAAVNWAGGTHKRFNLNRNHDDVGDDDCNDHRSAHVAADLPSCDGSCDAVVRVIGGVDGVGVAMGSVAADVMVAAGSGDDLARVSVVCNRHRHADLADGIAHSFVRFRRLHAATGHGPLRLFLWSS